MLPSSESAVLKFSSLTVSFPAQRHQLTTLSPPYSLATSFVTSKLTQPSYLLWGTVDVGSVSNEGWLFQVITVSKPFFRQPTPIDRRHLELCFNEETFPTLTQQNIQEKISPPLKIDLRKGVKKTHHRRLTILTDKGSCKQNREV